MTPDEQKKLDDRLIRAVANGLMEMTQTLLANGADVHAENDSALRHASFNCDTEIVKILLANGANVHAKDDRALRLATWNGDMETVKILAKHIFAPDSWRGKSRAEIETQAGALYNNIKAENPQSEDLHKAGTILFDHAMECWYQVRPAPPKIQISPLPAQPKPL